MWYRTALPRLDQRIWYDPFESRWYFKLFEDPSVSLELIVGICSIIIFLIAKPAVSQICSQPGALLSVRNSYRSHIEYLVFTFVDPYNYKGDLTTTTAASFSQIPLFNTTKLKGQHFYKITFTNICKMNFRFRTLDTETPTWFGVSDKIKTLISKEEILRWREGRKRKHGNKEKKQKKLDKVPSIRSESEPENQD